MMRSVPRSVTVGRAADAAVSLSGAAADAAVSLFEFVAGTLFTDANIARAF